MTTLAEITQKLTELRQQTEATDMEKAELFSIVKDEKLYRDGYETFSNYCESIGYTRQYVYMLIRIYQNETISEAQPGIGTMAANAIVSTANELELDDAQVTELVDYAKDHTARETSDYCQAVKLASQTPASQPDNVLTLAKALAQQTKLLQRKSDLESELVEINDELNKLFDIIRKLSS